MQVNLYSNIASITNSQVSNKKANDDSIKSTKEYNLQSANTKDIKQEKLDVLNSLGGKGLTQMYFIEFQQQVFNSTFSNNNAQAGILELMDGEARLEKAKDILSKIDFSSIGYEGKNILDMNSDELNALISEDGFFGVENTANRIADFVINGANGDIQKLQKGLEGMKRGFEEAKNMWGGELPKISQDTIDKALEKVSLEINKLGGNALNLDA